MLIGLLASIMNVCGYTKYIFLNNQQCMIQHTFINLNRNEYNQRLRYYPFSINLDRCMGACNTLN